MSTILDQTADASLRSLNLFSQRYEFPAYVKEASPDILDRDAHRPLSSLAFAEPNSRQFPCHTKAACWLSHVYFLEHSGQMPVKTAEAVSVRLAQAAARYGIVEDVATLRQQYQEKLAEPQLPDQAYLVVWQGDNGVTTREYPMRNPAEVQKAAAWFCQYRDHFPFLDRKVMADKLLKRADAFGAALTPEQEQTLEQQACHGTCDPKVAAHHIQNRLRLAGGETGTFRNVLAKMANLLVENPQAVLCPATMAEMANGISQFDELVKLAGHYTPALPRPEEIFCSLTIKEAEAALHDSVQLTTGNIYSRSEMAKVALGDVRAVLGDELAEAMATGIMLDPEKLAEVAPTLPRPEAVLLDKILASRDVLPFGKAATAVGMSFGEWDALARA